jgi:hypothetical protein
VAGLVEFAEKIGGQRDQRPGRRPGALVPRGQDGKCVGAGKVISDPTSSCTPIRNIRRGRLSAVEFEASEAALVEFIKARGNTKPYLADLT